jgi:energy-coupling factor transporter ATP-binding protein EcfA2
VIADDPARESALRALHEVERTLGTLGNGGYEWRPRMECPLRERLVSCAALTAIEAGPQEELLGPLCVRGQRVVVGGHTGAGKSTLTLAISKAIAHEEELLGWRGAGGKVLIVDLEQGLRTLKRRIAEVGLDESEDVDVLRLPEGIALDSDVPRREELHEIVAEGGYAAVALDPLYKAHGGDSNDERAMVDLMRILDGWRAQHGFALLIPMHMRKPPPAGGTLTMHDIFGSSGLVRGAEVVVGIERLSPGMSRIHFWKDRDGDLPVGEKWMLTFDREQGYERATQREKAVDVIAYLLTERPGLTSDEIAAETGFAARTVKATLKKLEAVGETTGNRNERRWSMPEVVDDEHYQELFERTDAA